MGDAMKREAAKGDMVLEAGSLADLLDCKHRYDFLSLQSRLDVAGKVLTIALRSAATPGFSFSRTLRNTFPAGAAAAGAGAAIPVDGPRVGAAGGAAPPLPSPIGGAAPAPTTPRAPTQQPDAKLFDAAALLMNVSTPLTMGATPGGAHMQLHAAEKREGKLLPNSTSAKQRLRADSLEFIRGKLADCEGDYIRMLAVLAVEHAALDERRSTFQDTQRRNAAGGLSSNLAMADIRALERRFWKKVDDDPSCVKSVMNHDVTEGWCDDPDCACGRHAASLVPSRPTLYTHGPIVLASALQSTAPFLAKVNSAMSAPSDLQSAGTRGEREGLGCIHMLHQCRVQSQKSATGFATFWGVLERICGVEGLWKVLEIQMRNTVHHEIVLDALLERIPGEVGRKLRCESCVSSLSPSCFHPLIAVY